jgi:uncharacterized membrane-anchored protein
MAEHKAKVSKHEGDQVKIDYGAGHVFIPATHAESVADALTEYNDKESGRDKPTQPHRPPGPTGKPS